MQAQLVSTDSKCFHGIKQSCPLPQVRFYGATIIQISNSYAVDTFYLFYVILYDLY